MIHLDLQDKDDAATLQLRVTEGDIVFLPCVPALGTNDVSIWDINGMSYPFTRLPQYHAEHYGGIILLNTTLNRMERATYRCFSIVNNSVQLIFTIKVIIEPFKGPKGKKISMVIFTYLCAYVYIIICMQSRGRIFC